jgi:hypothetical protein
MAEELDIQWLKQVWDIWPAALLQMMGISVLNFLRTHNRQYKIPNFLTEMNLVIIPADMSSWLQVCDWWLTNHSRTVSPLCGMAAAVYKLPINSIRENKLMHCLRKNKVNKINCPWVQEALYIKQQGWTEDSILWEEVAMQTTPWIEFLCNILYT